MARLQQLLQNAVDSGASVPEIARKAQLERSLVYKYLRGDLPNATVDTLERLCWAIGVSPAEVFEKPTAQPRWVIAMLEKLLAWAKGK